MRVRGTKPSEGRPDRNWKSVGVGLNRKLYGWIAGQGLGVTVHQGKPSKPCLRAYRGPKASCEKCEQGKPTTWLCFVPFYPSDSELRCVLHVHDDTTPALEQLDLHDYFCAFRGDDPSVGVQLHKEDAQPSFRPRVHTRMASACIADWLAVFLGQRGILSGRDLIDGAQYVPEPIRDLGDEAEARQVESSAVPDVVEQLKLGLGDRFKMTTRLSPDGGPFSERKPGGGLGVREPLNGKGKH
jgi:hypothetical protein